MNETTPTPGESLRADVARLRKQTLLWLQDVQIARRQLHDGAEPNEIITAFFGKSSLVEVHIALGNFLLKTVHAAHPESEAPAPVLQLTPQDIAIISRFLERDIHVPHMAAC